MLLGVEVPYEINKQGSSVYALTMHPVKRLSSAFTGTLAVSLIDSMWSLWSEEKNLIEYICHSLV